MTLQDPWQHTNKAIRELEGLLDCGVCGQLVKVPCTLGGCEHFFCRECVEKLGGEDCPVCRLPSHVRDVQGNRQLSTAVTLCRRLARLLSADEENDDGAEMEDTQETQKDETSDALLAPEISTSSKLSPVPKDDVASPPSHSPIMKKTRRATKIAKKKKAVVDSNTKWGIGGSTHEKCVSCPRVTSEEKRRVKFGAGEKMEQPDFGGETAEQPMCEGCEMEEPGKGGRSMEKPVEGGGEMEELGDEEQEMEQPVMGDSRKKEKPNIRENKLQRRNCPRIQIEAPEVEKEQPTSKENNKIRNNRIKPENSKDICKSEEKQNTIPASPQTIDCAKTRKQNGNILTDNTSSNVRKNTRQTRNKVTVDKDNVGLTRRVRSRRSIESIKDVKTEVQSTSVSGKSGNNLDEDIKSENMKVEVKSSPNVQNNKRSPRVRNSPASNTSKTTTTVQAQNVRKTRKLLSPSGTPQIQPWLSPAQATPTSRKRRSLSPRVGGASPRVGGASPRVGGASPRVGGASPRVGGASPMIGSPAMKKNAKGETPLHIACIKGDHSTVISLLDDGAAVNTKDNAGWTPLHEACNHGYCAIVASLLEHGALINVPGLDNDTPLHDAVRNNRTQCVKMLVQRGASLTARNINGKTPMDLAETPAMKKALSTPIDEVLVKLSQTELSSSQLIHDIVLLATGLNREQKAKLQKCADMLHAKLVQEFDVKVSHVVSSVNQQGQCPRTLKYLQAVLAGKWIVNFDWVETCLEYGDRVSEEAFEVPGASTAPDSMAPATARNNYTQQLPGLFDGCHFYLTGEFEYPTPSREDLSALIRLGGGALLVREPRPEYLQGTELVVPYHVCSTSELGRCSHYVVHGVKAVGGGGKDGRMVKEEGGRMCHVPAAWVMDSIAQFKLMDFTKNK